MSGQFYDNAQRRVYEIDAGSLATPAVLKTIQGPAGKIGRVRGIEYLITTGVTVAAATVTVGPNAGVGVVGLTVPIASAGAGGALSASELAAAGAPSVAGVNDVELAADTPVEIATGGEATAGAANIIVTIDWF